MERLYLSAMRAWSEMTCTRTDGTAAHLLRYCSLELTGALVVTEVVAKGSGNNAPIPALFPRKHCAGLRKYENVRSPFPLGLKLAALDCSNALYYLPYLK